MIICFIGAPGSGKSTQAKLLSKKLNINVYSLGDLIRGARKANNIYNISQNLFTNIIKSFEYKDILLDDSLIFRIIEELILITNRNLIIDGFPRSKAQIDYMQNNFIGESDFKLINISIDKTSSKQRILSRNRIDDKYIDQKRRIDLYFDGVNDLLNKFDSVDGDNGIQEVHKNILILLNRE